MIMLKSSFSLGNAYSSGSAPASDGFMSYSRSSLTDSSSLQPAGRATGYTLPASSPQLPASEYAPKYPAFPSFDTLGDDFYSHIGAASQPDNPQFKRYGLSCQFLPLSARKVFTKF